MQPRLVSCRTERQGLLVASSANLRSPETQAEFAALEADAAIVAAYGLILPAPILAAPRLGCLNVHASLLPRWRGAAPIQRAILADDTETGVAIMQMDEGLDTGPVLLQQAVPIGSKETAGALTERLAALGARMMVEALDGGAAGTLTGRAPTTGGAPLSKKPGRGEGHT